MADGTLRRPSLCERTGRWEFVPGSRWSCKYPGTKPCRALKELHHYRSELIRLHGELQGFQGAAEERDFLRLAHQKLLQKNGRLEAKVSELSQECERLNQRIVRERKKEEEKFLASRLSCPEFPTRGQVCKDQMPSQGGDGEPACLLLSEASRRGELGEPVQCRQGAFLKEILSAHQERPCPPRAALGSARGDTEQGPPHRGTLEPQEEPPGLSRDPRQAPVSGGPIKEQESSLQLRLEKLQLQKENIKVPGIWLLTPRSQAISLTPGYRGGRHGLGLLSSDPSAVSLQIQTELRQAQARLAETSEACGALATQGELCQQTVKELELEPEQQSQAARQQSRLLEQLSQESQRAAQAEKRVQELEQRLQEGQAALGRRQLEEEAREATAKEAEARRSLQEEQKRRKALEQQQEEQQQRQLRLWREKEAGLLQALADWQAQAQQREGQLRALEDEKRALAKEHLRCQSRGQRLSEQLSALQQEKETLCDAQRQILRQVDVSLRKQSERRLRHKARLRQVKETLLGEVKLRDTRIWNLENEVRLSESQAEKDQLLLQRVTSENEGLFREKRRILEQLHSLEEAKQSDSQDLCALQHRVQLLEGENKQLQDRTLQLSLQVGILERALRTIHVHSLQELKSLGFPECPLQRELLPFPGFSFSVPRLSDTSSLGQVIKGGQPAKAGQKALLSPLAFQSSRMGWLSVPRNPADLHQDEPGQPAC